MKSKFKQFADAATRRMFLGNILKYVKGDWEEGADKVPVSANKALVAVMGTLTVGHLKWLDGKVVDQRMGLVADGFHPAPRHELDDYDSSTWPVDKKDGPRIDPWSPTALLVLIAAAEPHDVMTFSTSTAGGQSALGALCAAHAQSTEETGEYPVVTLGSDSYLHKDREVGRVKVPVFKIIDSVDAAPFDAIVAEERGGAVFMPVSVSASMQIGSSAFGGPPQPPPITEAPEGPPAPEGLDELSSEIPF